MMMKSFIRWSAAMGLVAATVLGSGFNRFKAWALPNEQVLEILSPVPVFMIFDSATGSPITSTPDPSNREVPEALKDKSFVPVFIHHGDAKSFIDTNVKGQKPELAENLTVASTSLAKVYEEIQKEEYQEKGVIFQFVPTQESQASAQQILEQEGEEYKGGVPLFFVRDKESGQPIFSFEDNDSSKPVIAFFFDKDQLDDVVQQSNEENIDFDANFEIAVTSLGQVVETLVKEEDEELQKVRFVISAESEELIRQNLPANTPGQAAPEQTPNENQ